MSRVKTGSGLPLAAILAMALMACPAVSLADTRDEHLPEITRNLPSNAYQADVEFKNRVARTFVAPMRQSELEARLEKMGFRVEHGLNIAEILHESGSCITQWRILWRAGGTQVSQVDGLYNRMCS